MPKYPKQLDNGRTSASYRANTVNKKRLAVVRVPNVRYVRGTWGCCRISISYQPSEARMRAAGLFPFTLTQRFTVNKASRTLRVQGAKSYGFRAKIPLIL